ncbi:short chain dehydrogenase [Colletotrichum graminicola]|nr:short chain dehydrogenase [Colletotrichum graminicola]
MGKINLTHLFLPIVIKSKIKKAASIAWDHADFDFANASDVDTRPIYTASKAVMNAIISSSPRTYAPNSKAPITPE